MYIANAGLFVRDLEGARQFFEEHFGARVAFEYNEEENKYYSCIMEFDEGAKLELMTKPEIADVPKNPNRTGFAHIAIRVPSREKLDEVIRRFHEKGYHFFYEPAPGDGSGECRAVTFEDIVLEVNYNAKYPKTLIANVGMFVKDLEGARKFFEDFFGAELYADYNEEENKYYSYIMKVGDGAKLELMTKPQIADQPKDPNRTGIAHMAIRVDSREKLNEVIRRFHENGWHFFYEPKDEKGRECRVVTFEDNVLEVSVASGL